MSSSEGMMVFGVPSPHHDHKCIISFYFLVSFHIFYFSMFFVCFSRFTCFVSLAFQEVTFESNVLLSVVLIQCTFIHGTSWITTRCQQQHTEYNRTVGTGREANVFSLRAVPPTVAERCKTLLQTAETNLQMTKNFYKRLKKISK